MLDPPGLRQKTKIIILGCKLKGKMKKKVVFRTDSSGLVMLPLMKFRCGGASWTLKLHYSMEICESPENVYPGLRIL